MGVKLSLLPVLCVLMAGAVAATDYSGLVIRNAPNTWFSLKASNPNIIKFSNSDWRMWAYGRETTFNRSYANSIGRTGYFTSKDGIRWKPYFGDGVLGSVMDPRVGTDRFDSGEVGVTDIKFIDGYFYMWYAGVRDLSLPDTPGNFREGVAVSKDGVHWSRCEGSASFGSFLEGKPADGDRIVYLAHIFAEGYNPVREAKEGLPKARPSQHYGKIKHKPVKCARVIRKEGPEQRRHYPKGFRMLYNTLPATGELRLVLYGAESPDLFSFKKTGAFKDIQPSSNPAAFDFVGAASASILKVRRNEYVLFYEGVTSAFVDSIGLARSTDGIHFEKDTRCNQSSPGGPVLTPRFNQDAWDNFTMGTPFPVLQKDKSIYLYYVGISTVPVFTGSTRPTEADYASQIGLAVSVKNSKGEEDYCKFQRVPAVKFG